MLTLSFGNPVLVNVLTDVLIALCGSIVMSCLGRVTRVQNRLDIAEGKTRRWPMSELNFRNILDEWRLRRASKNLEESVAAFFLVIILILAVIHPLVDLGMDFETMAVPGSSKTPAINLLLLDLNQSLPGAMYWYKPRNSFRYFNDRGFNADKIRLALDVAAKDNDPTFGLSSTKRQRTYLDCRTEALEREYFGNWGHWTAARWMASCHSEILRVRTIHAIRPGHIRDEHVVSQYKLEDPIGKPQNMLTWGREIELEMIASTIGEEQAFEEFNFDPVALARLPRVHKNTTTYERSRQMTIPSINLGGVRIYNQTVVFDDYIRTRKSWSAVTTQVCKDSKLVTSIGHETRSLFFISKLSQHQHEKLCEKYWGKSGLALEPTLCEGMGQGLVKLYVVGNIFCDLTVDLTNTNNDIPMEVKCGGRHRYWEADDSGTVHLLVERLGPPDETPRERHEFSWTKKEQRVMETEENDDALTLGEGPTSSLAIVMALLIASGGVTLNDWTYMFARGILASRIFHANIIEAPQLELATVAVLNWQFICGISVVLIFTLLAVVALTVQKIREKRRGFFGYFVPQTAYEWYLTGVRETVTHSLCNRRPGELEAGVLYGIMNNPGCAYDHIGFALEPTPYSSSKPLYGRPPPNPPAPPPPPSSFSSFLHSRRTQRPLSPRDGDKTTHP